MGSKGGKGSRARAKMRRDMEKKARRDAQKRRYAEMALSGNNSKRKGRQNRKSTGLIDPRKEGRKAIPFPVHLWTDKKGNLKPGSPHKAFLAWREARL